MAICVNYQSGTLIPNGQSESECTAYLLQTANEVSLTSSNFLASLTTLFDQYLLFDSEVFMQIIGGSLVAYALGHSTGAVIKLLLTKPTLGD